MNKESLSISFRFRFNFNEAFSVCKLPSTDSDVSLSSLREERGQTPHKSITNKVTLRQRINASE